MEFLLVSSEVFAPMEGTTVSLGFRLGEQRAMEFAMHAGCNHIAGGFTLNEGVITTTYLMMTEMGCTQSLMAQDDWLIQFMSLGPTLVLEGAQLTLTGVDGVLVFVDREVANPDRSLAGPTWTIDTFIEGEGATGTASAVNMAEDPTVVFGEDGSLQVFTGCTHGVGNYTASDGTISLGMIGYDDVVCSDESLNWVDAHVQQVLSQGMLSFEIDAARLTLERGSVGLSARTE
jgi:heat shock protein HslJ